MLCNGPCMTVEVVEAPNEPLEEESDLFRSENSGFMEEPKLETPLLSIETTKSNDGSFILSDLRLDNPSEMSTGRKLARYLSKYEWYFPKLTFPKGVSALDIDAAWGYFEHVTLGRFADANAQEVGSVVTLRTKPNSNSDFYRISTSEKKLLSFGIGMPMYFRTVRLLALIFFVAFLLNSPLILYFSSNEYSESQESISLVLKGSAICTNQEWKPCPECNPTQNIRYAVSATNPPLSFIKVNECNISFIGGVSSWIACICILISIYRIRALENKKVEKFLSMNHKARDYSLCITNPPLDARDPEEWKRFFSSIRPEAHMTFCTIVLDNDDLLEALAQRKKYILEIDAMLPPRVEMDEKKLRDLVGELYSSKATKIYKKILNLEASIAKLSRKKYNVSEVIVTFESQADPQILLQKLSLSNKGFWINYPFRIGHFVEVTKPPEPSSINWEHLNKSDNSMLWQQTGTFLTTCLLTAISSTIIAIVLENSEYSIVIALTIAFFNIVTPAVVNQLMSFEAHRDETSMQRSLYLKICIFRWTQTAILLSIVTPFTSTLDEDSIIKNIFAIFLAEILTNPIISLMDIVGQFQRHYQAPRATDRRKMQSSFKGTTYNLAERYTDVSKIMFLTLYYSAIFPAGFLYGAFALFIIYWLDKFRLLRQWARGSKIGNHLVLMNYQFTIVILVIYVFSTYYSWYEFPYDNACPYEDNNANTASILNAYNGTHLVQDSSGKTFHVTVTSNDDIYTFCNQEVFPASAITPPGSAGQNWISPGQKKTTIFFGLTIVLFFVILYLVLFFRFMRRLLRHFFHGIHKENKEACEPRFSELEYAQAYIPQLRIPGYSYPFLLCDVAGIDKKYIGCEPLNGTYENFSFLNMFFSNEVDSENDGMNGILHEGDDADEVETLDESIFSAVKHWPSPISFSFDISGVEPTASQKGASVITFGSM